MMSKVAFIVLAAGKGTRFKSKTPKVLQKIAGLELVSHLLNTVNSPNSYLKNKKDIFVVVSHEKDKIISHIGNEVSFINQEHLNGTASAVSSCLGELHKYDKAIILYGDVPFIEIKTINNLLEGLDKNNLMLLTAVFDSPDGYGRIVRDKKNKSIKRIVEHKDANLDELLIQEVNSGILACNTKFLSEQLPNIKNNNAQKEYYLTDLVELAKSNDYKIGSICIKDVWEVYGINDAFHLGTAERYYQEKKAKNLMKSGVRIYDFKRLDIRGNLTCEQDVEIDINCIFIGEVFLASGVKVGANSVLIDCNIEKNTTILPMSHIEKTSIDSDSSIGPFARIRPNTKIGKNCKVGNFVEIKSSNVSNESKIGHLSYIGDSEIASNVNIGAGTITCNYDGINKHKTTIGEGAFIGSNTALVAPINIGKDVVIAAGSTIVKNVSKGLGVARGKQINIDKYNKNK